MDGVNGVNSLSSMDQWGEKNATTVPPRGKPAGAPEAEPDVELAISDLAQARMESLESPASADGRETMKMSTKNGGIDFGVDSGGFEWPLDAQANATVSQPQSETMNAWEAAKQVVNGVYVDDAQASESAYIALGKSTVNASE